MLAGVTPPARDLPDSAQVQLLLGQMALNKGQFSQAFTLFSIAARSGQAQALNMLGRAYEKGWGVPQALKYFNAAAAQHYGWAYFNLGDLYLSGDGVPADPEKAFHCYVQAACYGVNKALNMLGTLCENGFGTHRPDREKACQYFLAGAQEQDCWAAFNLGRLLVQEKESNKAAFWFEASLAYGFPEYWSFMHHYLLENPSHFFEKIQAKVKTLLSGSLRHKHSQAVLA